MKTYLSARQVVQRLNGAISVKTVYALVARGRLRVNRNLGKMLIEEESLIELLEGPLKPVAPECPPPPVRKRGRPRKHEAELELW